MSFNLNKGYVADNEEGPVLVRAIYSDPKKSTGNDVKTAPTPPQGEDGTPNDMNKAQSNVDGAQDHVYVNVEEKRPLADKPYAGMGKEDLLRFSSTPFWTRLRMICLIIFWLVWLGLLAAVIALTIVFPRCKAPPSSQWWHNATFYQVYVKSFYDYNGDGMGDIKGIQHKLDYLGEMKTNSVMVSAFYDGPRGGDFGYQLTDHMFINPDVGTIEDFDALIEEAHKKGIRVVIDFVPNYTGITHPWFTASAQKEATYRNFYVWADCEQNGTKPNNWVSVYGGSAWSYNATRGQCYLHQFLQDQPELNLRSAQVQEELEKILRFWLDRHVDGIRVTAAAFLYEDYDLRDETTKPSASPGDDSYDSYYHNYTYGQPENHHLIARWRTILDEYSTSTNRTRVLITDAHDTIEETQKYYGQNGARGAGIPINYGVTKVEGGCGGYCLRDVVVPWMDGMPYNTSANWLSGTQDMSRLASRVGATYTTTVNVLRMTLPGATFHYYGEEIGMTNVSVVDSRDPAPQPFKRDSFRTPMQWDNTTYAGFINGTNTPWLPIGSNKDAVNVKSQRESSDKTPWKVFKELTDLRGKEQALWYGNIHYSTIDDNIFSFIREYDGTDRLLVAVNFGRSSVTTSFSANHYAVPGSAEVALVTTNRWKNGDSVNLGSVQLDPGEAAIFKWAYSR